MADWRLGFGLGGTAFVGLCCVTPLLPWVLGTLGLTGLTGVLYRDAVLLPVVAGFVIFTGVTLWRRKHRK
ncbi:mercury resistance system transport protein MerF [Roseovarius ramblicola]|uniref:Mercury resistance system transport protein MerF n=1 Tax=Roseovarius ramblicola TaxID=2022336 RepID=A0ABV5I2K7_9RHOB